MTPSRNVLIDEERPAMSPAELQHSRTAYAKFIEAALDEDAARSPTLTRAESDQQASQRLHYSRTKVSSLARCLYISANEHLSLPINVALILKKVTHLTAGAKYGDFSKNNNSQGDLNAHRGEGDCNFNLDVEHTSDQGSPTAGAEKRSLSSKAKDNDASTMKEATNSVEDRSRHNFQTRIEETQVTTPSGDDFQIAAEETPVDITKKHFYQPEPWYHGPESVTWPEKLSICITIILSFVLSVPIFFMLVMDWLHSSEISPIFASSAGLLFSGSRFVSKFVEVLLGGLFLARIIEKTFQQQSKGWAQVASIITL